MFCNFSGAVITPITVCSYSLYEFLQISAIANLVTNSNGKSAHSIHYYSSNTSGSTAGQLVTLTPPPGSFYCDQESITCRGNGDIILWTAPPLILDPQGFVSNAMQQTPVRIGDIAITLTEVVPGTPPLLTSKLTLSNISEVNVTCQTDVPGSLNEETLIRSGKLYTTCISTVFTSLNARVFIS